MEYKDQSELYGGFDYLRRLDGILNRYNEAQLIDDLETMHRMVSLYAQELDSYCTDKDRSVIFASQKKLDELSLEFHNESLRNQKEESRIRNLFLPGVFKAYKVIFQAKKNYLENIISLRLYLQRIAKKSGLIMTDKPDPRRALLGGKQNESD